MKKIAIIGCGTIGNIHAEAYTNCEKAQIVYAIDIIPEKVKAFAEKYGIPNTETDYKKMLDDDSIDAVSVCTPNYLHAPMSIDSFRAGKHVLCEKPIALNLQDAIAMKEEADKHNVLCMIGVVNRYNDYVNLMKETIARGELGEVYHVNVMFQSYRSIPGLGGWFTTKKESGGGVMIDWGVHFFDIVLYCLDFPKPLTVSGVLHSQLAKNMKEYVYPAMWGGPPDYDGTYDVEECVSGVIRTTGPSISFEGAWARNVNTTNMYIEFLGSKGGIKLNYGEDFTIVISKDGELHETTPALEQSNHFQNEMDAFIESIITQKKSRSDIGSVLINQQINDAFYKSAAMGKEVVI